MPYTADPTNLTTPADGDLIANCPAEVRGVKTLLANTIATKQTIIADATISADTTLTAASSGKTFILDGGVVTLPNPVRFTKLKFINPSGATTSIKSAGSASVYYPDDGSVAAGVAIGLSAGVTIELYADSYNWFIASMTGEVIVRKSALPNAAARVDQLYGKGMSNVNYTSSGRAYGTVYPNSTVAPKFVAVTVGDMAGGDVTLQADAGAGYIVLDKTTDYGNAGSTQKLSGFIPAGANYKVVLSAGAGSPALVNWVEYGL